MDSAGNIAMSGTDLALLEVEITPFHGASTEELDSPNESRGEG